MNLSTRQLNVVRQIASRYKVWNIFCSVLLCSIPDNSACIKNSRDDLVFAILISYFPISQWLLGVRSRKQFQNDSNNIIVPSLFRSWKRVETGKQIDLISVGVRLIPSLSKEESVSTRICNLQSSYILWNCYWQTNKPKDEQNRVRNMFRSHFRPFFVLGCP